MEFEFSTRDGDVLDLTDRVQELIPPDASGLVSVFLPHATGVLFLGEYEPGINRDYRELAERLAPRGAGWSHDRIDSNAHAHLRSAIFGAGVVVPVRGGRLQLGTWQRIIFVENDGPRKRRAIVTLIGGGK